MTDWMSLAITFIAGLLFGAVFFGGLWWTVRRGMQSKRPALVFVVSLILRLGFVLSGFYWVSDGQWQRLLLCLIGFFVARVSITLLAGSPVVEQPVADSPGTNSPVSSDEVHNAP
jgi:F1F0 ATPase subunit 2